MAVAPEDQGLDYAWKWFALHAAQRMQTLNYFLVATAFLVAAYGSLLQKNLNLPAVIVALVGAWTAIWFTRLDKRTRQLIAAGEVALKIFENRLADKINVPELRILSAVDQRIEGASYRTVIAVIEWTVAAVFFLGAGYAAYLAVTRTVL
jgi:hypothetical protein